jgi:tetrahydromethanopterin S-methyltransferase subunit G
MSEIEIKYEDGQEPDNFGRSIGILVGVIGIVLAVVTIASHREHTAAVIHKTEANDQWSFYQAKKIREHVLDVGVDMLGVLASPSAKMQDTVAKMTADRDRYAKESDAIKQQAEAMESESMRAENRALRFDVGEGLLELGLVLCSLYFLSKKKSFPAFGACAALVGALLGISGFFM